MSKKINIHIENIVLDGFSKQEGNQIVEAFKTSLTEKIKSGAIITKQDLYMSSIAAKPIIVSNKAKSSDIGQQASESLFKSINS